MGRFLDVGFLYLGRLVVLMEVPYFYGFSSLLGMLMVFVRLFSRVETIHFFNDCIVVFFFNILIIMAIVKKNSSKQ